MNITVNERPVDIGVEAVGKIPKQVDDPFAEVFAEQMEVRGEKIDRVAIMLQPPAPAPEAPEPAPIFVAEHSADYRLIPNEYVHQTVKDLLTRSGLGEVRPINIVWTGKRYLERYLVPEVDFGVGNSRVSLGVQATNSYDGSTAFGIEFFACHLQCENQFHIGNLLGSFRFKHVNGSTDVLMADALEELRAGSERFVEFLPYIEAMQGREIDLDRVLTWFHDLSKASPAWPQSNTAAVLASLRDQPRNEWGLLNAFTEVTTHRVGGISGVKLSRAVCDYALGKAKPMIAGGDAPEPSPN